MIENVSQENSWFKEIEKELTKPYFLTLKSFLTQEYSKHLVFPEPKDILNTFTLTPFNKVNVVIIGQDPYHGKQQANGLCFSVKKEVAVPPSLKNIYKELKNDINKDIPTHGDLSDWSKQGVLLLNTTLTVRHKEPTSHQKKGWETFTDHCIKTLSTKKTGLVFLLWGKHAQKKEILIDIKKHHILKTSHPSPFSAHKGFLGSNHFSKTNEFLKQQNKPIISW